jgi:EpsD family peptidyl-prolyl cis-trans isomerase
MIKQAYSGRRIYRNSILGAMMALPLLTAGCNRNDAPSGQTIATVNGDDITTSDLQLEMGNVPPEQRKKAQALVARTLVDRRLLSQYAKEQGIDKNPQFVLQLRRMTELLLAERAATQISAASQQPISISEINKYLDNHPSLANRRILTLDQLTFPMPDSKVAVELNQATTMDSVIATLQRHNIQFSRAQPKGDTATLRDDLSSKLDTLKPGEPLIILNQPNSTANVIIDSKPVPLDNATASNIARRAMNAQRANDALQQRGMALRKQAKISYAKGYAPPAPGVVKP